MPDSWSLPVPGAADATPMAPLPLEALTGDPLSASGPALDGGTAANRTDATGGTATTTGPAVIAPTAVMDSSRQRADDAATLQILAADLGAHLPVGYSSDPIGGTPASSSAVAVMNRVFQACGEAVVTDPVGGVRSSPTILVRRSLQLDAQQPIPADAATRLLRRATGLENPYELADVVIRRRELTDGQRQDLFSTDPDETDPLVQATLTRLTDPAPDGNARLAPLAAAGGPDPVRLGADFRSAMLRVRRWWSRAAGQYDRPSDVDGQLAHTIIGLHYVATHLDHPVIIDRFAWTPATATLQTLADAAGGDAALKAVQGWLVSAVTGLVGQPDILDMDIQTREVYEIKPLHRIFDGAAQLVARYLLPLNIGVLGTEAAARALIQQLLPTPGPGPTQTGPRPFLPGTSWYPSQIYPLPDGRFMFAVRAVPGVIGYQILGNDKADADGPSLNELKSQISAAMATLAAITATSIAVLPATDQQSDGVLASPVGRQPIDINALAQAAAATGLTLGTAYAAWMTAVTLTDLLANLAPLLLFLLA